MRAHVGFARPKGNGRSCMLRHKQHREMKQFKFDFRRAGVVLLAVGVLASMQVSAQQSADAGEARAQVQSGQANAQASGLAGGAAQAGQKGEEPSVARPGGELAGNAAQEAQPAASEGQKPQEAANAKPSPEGGTPKAEGEPSKSADASKGEDMQGPVYFVDESPIQVVKIYETLTGKTAIMSAQIPDVKINFAAPKMVRSELAEAIKSLLAVNGIAINAVNDKFFRVSPATAMNTQAPEFITGRAQDLPPSQNFYSKFFTLKYLDVETFDDAVMTFITPNAASLTIFSRNNSFMLTDTLSNIQRVEMLVEKMDKQTDINEDVTFITLKNMSAEDMKRRIITMQGDILRKYFGRATIDSDERTNQLIVVSPKGSSKFIKEFVKNLDIDSQPITRSRVFYIKHGEAKNVANVLNQIVRGQQNAVRQANQQRTAQANQMNINNRIANAINRSMVARGGRVSAQAPMNILADLAGATLQFSEYITIVADERSNSIVCYGTPSDLAQIDKIINEVDIVLNQVKIDVIITEVTLTDRQVSGLSTFGLNYQLAGTTTMSKGWSGNTATWSPNDSDTTGAFTISASEQGFSAVFDVARQNSSVKILSSPSIVTTHNKDAEINVSKRYPILQSITSTYTSSTPYTTSSVDWQDIGIILEVTPLIGDNGVVQMEIKQTVTTVIDYTEIDTSTQPIIGKRYAESFVSAKAGETIVLAGLQQTNHNRNDGSVWLLGDIPLIGELFKPNKTTEERTELIIFIRPTLIKSDDHSKLLTNESIESSDVGKNVRNYFEKGKFETKPIRNSVDEGLIERIKKRKYVSSDGLANMNMEGKSEEDGSAEGQPDESGYIQGNILENMQPAGADAQTGSGGVAGGVDPSAQAQLAEPNVQQPSSANALETAKNSGDAQQEGSLGQTGADYSSGPAEPGASGASVSGAVQEPSATVETPGNAAAPSGRSDSDVEATNKAGANAQPSAGVPESAGEKPEAGGESKETKIGTAAEISKDTQQAGYAAATRPMKRTSGQKR